MLALPKFGMLGWLDAVLAPSDPKSISIEFRELAVLATQGRIGFRVDQGAILLRTLNGD
jgi:hypothetical protein